MSVSLNEVQDALADLLAPEQVPDARVSGDKIIVTVAADIPMHEKPAFANKVKERLAKMDGIGTVLVHYAAPAQAQQPQSSQGPQQPTGPTPLKDVKHIIAIGAGKGGVGKSTVSVNLAVSLARAGHKVGLMDADIYGPSVAIMTGTQKHKAQGDDQQRVVPPERHGIKVVSMAFLIPEEKSAIVWRGPMVGKMVTQLLTGVAWGELDYLIVDLPPGTGDAVLSLTQAVPLTSAIVVTTPQDVALIDVMKAIEMFKTVKVPVAGIVENMAGFTCPHCNKTSDIFRSGAAQTVADKFGIPVLGRLPLDPAIPPGGDSGTPISIAAPESASAKTFAAMAETIASSLSGAQRKPIDIAWK